MRYFAAVFVALMAFAFFASTVVADEPTAEDYMKFWKPIVGTWEMITSVDDEVSVSTWTCRPSPTKWCYMSHGSSEGLPEFQTIDGYDPELKCWKAVAFDTEGGHRIRLVHCDMSKAKRVSKGAAGTTEERYVSADGKITNTTTSFTCLEASKDRVVWLLANRIENGKPQADMKVVCERVEKKRNRASP
jgi:hypothetical protein